MSHSHALVTTARTALVVFGGLAVDSLVGDPRRGHPVAVFGRAADRAERAVNTRPADRTRSRLVGAGYAAGLVGVPTLAVAALDRALAGRPVVRGAFGVTVVWACLGGTTLARVAGEHRRALERGDLEGARALLPWLCGRDPAGLDAGEIARAVVESVAENTSDAVVATVFWAAVAGPAGAVAHRAANTLDAMVGHRSERHRHFGLVAARLDDVLGWPAARLTGPAVVLAAPLVGGSPGGALRAWRRDAPAHPSPNAGVAEATCAGALGVRLGGRTPYAYGVQERPALGGTAEVQPTDIERAVRLTGAAQVVASVLAVLAVAVAGVAGGPRVSRR